MLYRPEDYSECADCGEQKRWDRKCSNCDKIAKLKGLICPCCKGTDIELSQTRKDNGILGPGFSSWVTSEHFVCNNCGVMFLDVRKKA